MRKISLKFKDYARSIVQNDYVLSDGDKFFLKGFKEYYVDMHEMVNNICVHIEVNHWNTFQLIFIFIYCRKDVLKQICTLVKAADLRKILDDGTSMDTNIMYYYFEILREGYDTCFIADPSVCVSKITVLL